MEGKILTVAEVRELAQNLDWGNPFEDKECVLESLRTNWEEPLSEESVQAVYEEMCKVWNEHHPWYAVLKDHSDNDWGTGTYDFEDAKNMCIELGCSIVAEIDLSMAEPMCDREYVYGEDFELSDDEILQECGYEYVDARKHIKNGTIVFKDFEEHLEEHINELCYDCDEDDTLPDELRKMAETKGKYLPIGWDSVEICKKRYYIMFVL